MSLQVMGWAIEYQDMPLDERTNRTLTSAKVVLMALANHAGRHGEDCFPSVETIQDYTGLSDRMIQYALRRLEEHGTIAKTPDPMVRQSTIGRQDRRPQSYDIVAFNGVQDRNSGGSRGARSEAQSGATGCNVSGDLAPEPVLEPVLELQEQPKSTSSADADAPPRDPPQPPLINQPVAPVQAGVQPEHRQDEEDHKSGAEEAGDGHLPLLDESPAGRSCSPTRKQLAAQHWDEFWQVWQGKKLDRPAAETKWIRAVVALKADPQMVIAAARAYRAQFNGDLTYMKHPKTWLHNQCWENELETPAGAPPSPEGARDRLRRLADAGDAETAAREAGVAFGGWNPGEAARAYPELPAGDRLRRWGQAWIEGHESELVDGMTRRAL